MLHKLGKMVWTTIITSSLSLQVVVVIDTGSDGRWWWVIYGVVAASSRQVGMDNIGGERLWEARCIERGVLLQLVFRSPVTRLEKNWDQTGTGLLRTDFQLQLHAVWDGLSLSLSAKPR